MVRIDTDVAQKLEVVLDMFRDDLFTKMKNGAEYAAEVVKATNVQKLGKAADSMLEAVENLVQVTSSMAENGFQYAEDMKKVQAAFNGGE